MSHFEDGRHFRRKFPRKLLHKRVGVLFDGQYLICESGEIGEGGMSITSEYAFSAEREVVVSFQIPGGSFVSLRGEIRSVITQQGKVSHGVAFADIPFAYKRQIRAFVSARTSVNKTTFS